MRIATILAVILATALSLCSPAAAQTTPAQAWPQRPVKFMLPLGPGSGADIGARLIAEKLTAKWGQPVVVENRPGGNSGVGAQAVERAPADGLTLLVAPDSTFTANPALFSKMIYNPDNFTPIAVL